MTTFPFSHRSAIRTRARPSVFTWNHAPPESNGRVPLPLIAPEAMKRLGSRATQVEQTSSIALDHTQGHDNCVELLLSAKHFMALTAIEGNRTHPFDLAGTGSKALHDNQVVYRSQVAVSQLSCSKQ